MADPKFELRTGDAGPLVTGTPGHVLTMQPDGTVRADAIGSVAFPPLPLALWVDKASTASSEDGSVAQPFKTFGAAVAALGVAGGTLMMVSGDYSGEPSRVIDTTNPVAICNVGQVDSLAGDGPLVLLPPITTINDTGALTISGCVTSTIGMTGVTGPSLLSLFQSTLGGALTGCGTFNADDTVFNALWTCNIALFHRCFFLTSGNVGTARLTVDLIACNAIGAGPDSITFSIANGVLRSDPYSFFNMPFQVIGVGASIILTPATPLMGKVSLAAPGNIGGTSRVTLDMGNPVGTRVAQPGSPVVGSFAGDPGGEGLHLQSISVDAVTGHVKVTVDNTTASTIALTNPLVVNISYQPKLSA